MKKLLLLLLFIPLVSFGQEKFEKQLKFDPETHIIQAEVSCGICMFDMVGKECELAIRIKDS
ncbi:MAG: DUF6370 family protein, partial [Flavobacteriaceae bacterium]|nr:DUF6370 family protein [Flavobacteriaceae bacterium]